jgi:hypothetical protein
VAAGLFFEGLKNFRATLPTQQDRGNALEVFAKACLATQKLVETKEMWPPEFACPSRTWMRMVAIRHIGVGAVGDRLEGILRGEWLA